MTQRKNGFTILELLVVIVLLAVIGIVTWNQINNLESMRRDDQRRSDINSLYYNLEEIYFAKNKLYPITLSEENLPGIDDVAFKDTNDVLINQDNSEYQYKPLDCSKAGCKGYTLRADLENEADFVKNNR